MIIEQPLQTGQPRRKVWCTLAEITTSDSVTYRFKNLPINALGFGSIVYVVDSPGLILYYDNGDGTLYKKGSSGGGGGGASTISDLEDVALSNLEDGQTLIWDADLQKFVNGNAVEQTHSYEQLIASDTWTITHNLNRYPSVTVVDSGGNVVTGDVTYLDSNTVQIVFTGAFSGSVYLN